MKAIKLFLLTFLLGLAFMVQCADARLITIRIEGIVGPDVPAVGGGQPDLALYPPMDQIFSETIDDPLMTMTMTFTVDLDTECDDQVENLPVLPAVCEKPDPNDCGQCCYYNGMVVALTLEVGDYRCDYGRAEPYLYPASALTYPGDDGFGYQEDVYQYNKVHDDKYSFEVDIDGEFVDHFMLEHRLMFGTGGDKLLTGVDYYDGDLGGVEYTYKVIGCSFAITSENNCDVGENCMFDNTDFPDYDLPIDPDPYAQQKLCRWAILFGRADKIAAGITAPYKVQGAVTSYEVIDSDTKTETDVGDCFIKTTAYGSILEPHVKILRKFRDHFLQNKSSR